MACPNGTGGDECCKPPPTTMSMEGWLQGSMEGLEGEAREGKEKSEERAGEDE